MFCSAAGSASAVAVELSSTASVAASGEEAVDSESVDVASVVSAPERHPQDRFSGRRGFIGGSRFAGGCFLIFAAGAFLCVRVLRPHASFDVRLAALRPAPPFIRLAKLTEAGHSALSLGGIDTRIDDRLIALADRRYERPIF